MVDWVLATGCISWLSWARDSVVPTLTTISSPMVVSSTRMLLSGALGERVVRRDGIPLRVFREDVGRDIQLGVPGLLCATEPRPGPGLPGYPAWSGGPRSRLAPTPSLQAPARIPYSWYAGPSSVRLVLLPERDAPCHCLTPEPAALQAAWFHAPIVRQAVPSASLPRLGGGACGSSVVQRRRKPWNRAMIVSNESSIHRNQPRGVAAAALVGKRSRNER